MKQQLKDTAHDIKNTVKDTGREAVSQVTDQANRMIDTQKQMVSEKIDSFAESIQDAARCVTDRQPQIGRFMQQAGERVGSVSTFLKGHDLRDAVVEVNRFGRQHPAILLGGLFVAGIVAARFLKASKDRHDDEDQRGQASASRSYSSSTQPGFASNRDEYDRDVDGEDSSEHYGYSGGRSAGSKSAGASSYSASSQPDASSQPLTGGLSDVKAGGLDADSPSSPTSAPDYNRWKDGR